MSIDKELQKILFLQEYSYHHSSLTEEDDEIDDQTNDDFEDVDIPDDETQDDLNDEPTIEDVPDDTDFNVDSLNQDEINSNVEEIDITDLKNEIDIIKQSIENNQKFSDNIVQALEKLNFIETKLGNIDSLNAKLDSIEKDIEERNPTPVEKLELSSLNSFPYNTKLNNYFSDVDNDLNYEVNVNKIEPNKTEEPSYELTDDDLRNGYNEYEIRKSF